MNVPKVITKTPEECTEEEVNDFAALVESGGEVEREGLRDRVRHAAVIAFAMEDSLCGVAALKYPAPAYRSRIESKAEVKLPKEKYTYELGWVFVKPEFRGRGLSRRLVKAVISASDGKGLFATSRADNVPMHKSLERFGFKPLGKSYLSDRRNQSLILFARLPAK